MNFAADLHIQNLPLFEISFVHCGLCDQISSWFDCVSPCIRNLCTSCQKLANKIEAPKFGYNKPFLDHLSIKKIGQCNNNKNKDFHSAPKFENKFRKY